MKTRTILLTIILLLLANNCFAAYTIKEHVINIAVDSEGYAQIIEKYTINFKNETDKIVFRNQSVSLGSDLEKWTEFDSEFEPNIGIGNVTNGKISYAEGNPGTLEISYELTEKLMAVGKETSMMAEYQLKANYWNKFYQSGVWIIPDSVKIEIELPAGAEIKEEIEPSAIINSTGPRKKITWEGYKSANRLTLKYVLWKKVTPVVDLNSIITFLFKTTDGLILVAITTIVLLALIWKRKTIIKSVEEFVENNSILEEE